jgi:hypothetical protein
VANLPFTFSREIFFPDTVSVRVKSGAVVPNATIVEGVLAII